MATSSLPTKPTRDWKRAAVIGLFGGFGIALAAAVLFALIVWYGNRPKQWDAQAIRAHYNRSYSFVTLEDWYQKSLKTQASSKSLKTQASSQSQEVVPPTPPGEWITYMGKITLQVSYDMENSTNSDYTLEPPNTAYMIPMQKLEPKGTLIDGKGLKWAVAEPMNHLWILDEKAILIPARQTVRVSFSMGYDINGDDSMATSVTDWNDNKQREFARHLLTNVDSFVLIDEAHHYRIELPLQEAFR